MLWFKVKPQSAEIRFKMVLETGLSKLAMQFEKEATKLLSSRSFLCLPALDII
jgi:hypothetical protein